MRNESKRFRLVLCSIVAMVGVVSMLATTAGAQVFYAYPEAPPVKADQPVVGVTVGFGDHLFRTVGYGRFNVGELSDFGIEIVADHISGGGDGLWRSGLAGDFKYAIIPANSTLPFDLALNGGLGFEKGGSVVDIHIPLGGLISRPIELNSGRLITPYGGLYVLIVHTSWDLPPFAQGDDSDWASDVELRGGASIEISDVSNAFVSLHLGAGTRFYVGFRYSL